MEDKVATKYIFVIMPFVKTKKRNQEQLDAFFKNNIKDKIEKEESFDYRYVVSRSDDQFQISEYIIRNLYSADIVIADMSGERPNPNVMFELGIRLSISNKPVILIREQSSGNVSTFSTSGFYCFDYDPFTYGDLEDHIRNKIIAFERKSEDYYSPVWKALKYEPSIIRELEYLKDDVRLRMLCRGLLGFQSKLQADLHTFISENLDLKLPKTSGSFIRSFKNNKNRLESLKWAEFTFKVKSIPSLEAFLAEPPINIFGKGQLASKVILYFGLFFDGIVDNDSTWKGMDSNHILRLIEEVQRSNEIAIKLSNYIEATSEEKQSQITKQVVAILQSSIFKNLMDKLESISIEPKENS